MIRVREKKDSENPRPTLQPRGWGTPPLCTLAETIEVVSSSRAQCQQIQSIGPRHPPETTEVVSSLRPRCQQIQSDWTGPPATPPLCTLAETIEVVSSLRAQCQQIQCDSIGPPAGGEPIQINGVPTPTPFQNTNIGGGLSDTFTAHLDDGFPYNPIGFIFHELKDVAGKGSRSPCP